MEVSTDTSTTQGSELRSGQEARRREAVEPGELVRLLGILCLFLQVLHLIHRLHSLALLGDLAWFLLEATYTHVFETLDALHEPLSQNMIPLHIIIDPLVSIP